MWEWHFKDQFKNVLQSVDSSYESYADSQVIAGVVTVVVLPISSQEDLDTKDSKEEEKKPTAASGTTHFLFALRRGDFH